MAMTAERQKIRTAAWLHLCNPNSSMGMVFTILMTAEGRD